MDSMCDVCVCADNSSVVEPRTLNLSREWACLASSSLDLGDFDVFWRFLLFWAVFGHMLPGTYMYDMLPCALQTYHRDHILLNFRQISENRCFRSILDLVKIVKTLFLTVFPLFWAVFGHMLPGTYMYDMLPCTLQTYHRDHILLNFRQISENLCFRSILDLVKIVKTVCFWPFFAVLSGFWPYVTMDICMVWCSMRSKPITAIISCSIFVKSVEIGVLGPFWT